MELSLRRPRRGSDFKPPIENRFVLRLMYLLLPFASKALFRIRGIEIDGDSLSRLKGLNTGRVVLLPNHPTDRDAVVMFHLSRLLGERFNYLAARELFDLPPMAWILQRCGAYSVMRGRNDRRSFKTTVRLLLEGERKLVIFPEGLTCWQNDTVMPFQEGVPLFGFWALEKMKDQGTVQPIYLVPMAIKYVFVRSMRRQIDRSLRRLERKLGLHPEDRSSYGRLRDVGEAVLTSAEKEYGVRPGPAEDFDHRLQSMKDLLVARIATAIGVSLRPEQNLPARIRVLVNALNEVICQEPEGPEYRLELHKERRAELEHLFDGLSRVLHFVATYDGYVRETMTVERFLDVIGQLETEVFGRRSPRGPSKVFVRIGKPVNIARHFDEYRNEKRRVLTDITSALEENVKQMLADLGRFATPL
jgi:1-acyl-sn-glycerol-3-phosphate acyltransferase